MRWGVRARIRALNWETRLILNDFVRLTLKKNENEKREVDVAREEKRGDHLKMHFKRSDVAQKQEKRCRCEAQ